MGRRKHKHGRKRRNRSKDARAASIPAQLTEYRPGESARTRHLNRLLTNLEYEQAVYEWATGRGLDFEVKNGGHHWILRAEDGFLAEWWPSSAKLVFRKRWSEGIHTHDYIQMMAEVEAEQARHVARLAASVTCGD